eukprot:3617952-Rhodomonas_salina.2
MKALFRRGSKKEVTEPPGLLFVRNAEEEVRPFEGKPTRPALSQLVAQPVMRGAKRLKERSKTSKDTIAGIGVQFRFAADGAVYIASMSPDGAVAKSGALQEGDCLVAIDSEPVLGMDADHITKKIIGPPGS